MQTLERLERDATLRAEKVDDDLVDLDRVYHQTDAVLADAGMSRLPPTSFDARIRQQFDREGFFVEIRRRICVARDHHTTSEAYWQFSPHPSFSKRFIFEQVRIAWCLAFLRSELRRLCCRPSLCLTRQEAITSFSSPSKGPPGLVSSANTSCAGTKPKSAL